MAIGIITATAVATIAETKMTGCFLYVRFAQLMTVPLK